MHRFDPKHAAKLDDPKRLMWQPIDKIIRAIDVHTESRIVDFGCGTCYLSAPLAKKFPEATVYAVDVSPEMLDMCKQKELPPNLQLVEFKDGATSLEDKTADRIVIVNTMHELVEDVSALNEIIRIAADDSKFIIIDWKKKEMEFGPPVSERLDPGQVLQVVENMGFKLELIDERTFRFHYLIKFVRI